MPEAKITYPVIRGEQRTLPAHTAILHNGPCIPVVISALKQPSKKEKPVAAEGFALIDTGATYTCIDDSVCRLLNLSSPSSKLVMGGIGGTIECLCYPVQVQFNIEGFKVAPLPVYRAASLNIHGISPHSGPLIALIGRDLLAYFKMTYDGRNGFIQIEY